MSSVPPAPSSTSMLRCAALAGVLAALCSLPLAALPEESPASPPATATAGTLKLLNYNVHGLHPLVTGDATRDRLRAIAGLLHDLDVVALQENFLLRAKLGRWLSFRSGVYATERRWPRPAGPGLATLSQGAILASAFVPFVHCHGRLTAANDCLANKGLLFTRLALDGAGPASLDLYNLHLDAGSHARDAEARHQQARILLREIGERSESRAVVVVGDINELRWGGRVDSVLAEAGLTDPCSVVPCPGEPRIERFLVRSGDDVVLEPVAWQLEGRFVDESGRPLSDHPAVSLALRWRATAQSVSTRP